MARIRTIKPEFWSSEQVMECSPITRLLFIGLWNFCDDAGNLVNSERTIKAQVFPGDDISASDVRRMLDELSSNGLIAFYVVEGKGYLHVTGWDKHQRIDRPTYKYPPCPVDDSSSARRMLVEASPPEWNGMEGKGREGKGEEKDAPAAPAKAATAARTYLGWVKSLPDDEDPLPATDPVFSYAKQVGLSDEFMALAWAWFENTYGPDGPRSSKRYTDWRKVFRNAVEGNWGKLWYVDGDGYRLTTVGLQLQRALRGAG